MGGRRAGRIHWIAIGICFAAGTAQFVRQAEWLPINVVALPIKGARNAGLGAYVTIGFGGSHAVSNGKTLDTGPCVSAFGKSQLERTVLVLK